MIIEEKLLTEPNYLLTKIKQVTQSALINKALQPIETNYEQVESNNIPFLVRIIDNLARKDQETTVKNQNFNPFLPYEKNLFVSDVLETHLCVLNKFNVVDDHLLIITRDFEDQESLLNQQDFLALSACFHQINGLAFYNCGKTAGASVKHKHLQIVPFPLSPFSQTIPLETVLNSDNLAQQKSIFQLDQFPFKHCFAKINQSDFSKLEMADYLYQIYLELLSKLAIKFNKNKPDRAYNLLITRHWMLIVPRQEESYHGISINSLGFAGLLLVRNHEQLALLKKESPINILRKLTLN